LNAAGPAQRRTPQFDLLLLRLIAFPVPGLAPPVLRLFDFELLIVAARFAGLGGFFVR
jgi:hypothetical protein